MNHMQPHSEGAVCPQVHLQVVTWTMSLCLMLK